MRKLLSILWNSFKMALQELRVNKLRTFLSLFGITIGIFCIIGVLATVNSLEAKVQSDVSALGNTTIYVSKWSFGGGAEYPWWQYVNRPQVKYNEVKLLKEKTSLAANIAFFISRSTSLIHGNNELQNVGVYGITEDFSGIQSFKVDYGRYFTENEFQRGNYVAVIGYENATQLFGSAEAAVDKTVVFQGKTATVIGVINKQGSTLIGDGFDYDNCVLLTLRCFASIYNVNSFYDDPFIMVNAKQNVPVPALMDELEASMRQIRRLSPTEEDNFSLNDINTFSDQISGFFGSVNLGGWAIAGLSLIVGAFGVANIMFVTVRERTSQIGLKKAIGAKSKTILTEFLLESAFLCILGGLIGLLLVWLLSVVLSSVLPFPIVISGGIIMLAFSICIILGILSGIIPASIAAKMNPVEAIRS